MQVSRRLLLGGAAALSTVPLLRAHAQAKPKIRLGVLTDLSGTYRDNTGPGSVACTRQAVTEFNPSAHGFDVEVISADHQNKPDVASTIAREWCDQGVDALVDVPTSSVALAVAQVVKEKDKIMLNGSATTTDLTDKQCSPNTIVWSFDTYMMAQSQGGSTVKAGGKTWFFITADYVFGHILEEQTAALVEKAGGKVLGKLRYPFPDTTDFASYLQQAQASGAQVLGLANAGLDTVNSIKQAHEFGLSQTMKICPLLIFITDVHSLGLQTGAGPDLHHIVLLGPQRSHARLHQADSARDVQRRLSEHGACLLLCGDVALSEGGGGHGWSGRKEERARHSGDDEVHADRRRRLRQGQRPRGRTRHVPCLSMAGEEAIGEQDGVGRLQSGAGVAALRGHPSVERQV